MIRKQSAVQVNIPGKVQPDLVRSTVHTAPEPLRLGRFKSRPPSLLQSEFKISLGNFVRSCLKD